MISQSILFEAKAFLCWEKFPDLSIKFMSIEEAIAFFYPPAKNVMTINLFYKKNTKDYSLALCLLFHEAGHLQQWRILTAQNRADEFERCTNLDKGEQKIQFEREAWQLGGELLNEFLTKINIDKNIFNPVFKSYAEQSLLTYKC